MLTPLVLTVIGPDRPGLVAAVSDTVARGGGNWLESRMARLAGAFAGIVLVEVEADSDSVPTLTASLAALAADDVHITVAPSGAETASPGVGVTVNLVAHDRPGIVRQIASVLSRQAINIEEMTSDVASAPFTGERMFSATLSLRLPTSMAADTVRALLEPLANELMLDINLG